MRTERAASSLEASEGLQYPVGLKRNKEISRKMETMRQITQN